MEIRNYNTHNYNQNTRINFKKKMLTPEDIHLGEFIVNNTRSIDSIEKKLKNEPPLYLRIIRPIMRKIAPTVEEKFINSKKKYSFEDLVNVGNVLKELVCMVVYPLQVLTNPDLPKEKRRFVGLYDFFVTCFSLTGTLVYMWKGKKLAKSFAEKVMKKYTQKPDMYPKAKRAVEGGAFVVGLAVQTILFKRILAPALSPPLAAKARIALEKRDAQKAALKNGNKNQNKKDTTLVPTAQDAALNSTNQKVQEFKNKSFNK